MGRIWLAIRSFFSILFSGSLPEDALTRLGLARRGAPKPQTTSAPAVLRPSDGAVQMLSILQRDARLIDFIMEDISAYSDDQVGAAVRGLHDQSREALSRYLTLVPVIDSVEGTFAKAPPGEKTAVTEGETLLMTAMRLASSSSTRRSGSSARTASRARDDRSTPPSASLPSSLPVMVSPLLA